MENRFAVIMAGGKGERFWPASRLKQPKHLLPIVGDEPMLAQTVKRLDGFMPPENVFVITNLEQLEATREVCPILPDENVVAEPIGRDTAAAVGLAMLLVRRRDENGVMAMLPADACIKDAEGFQKTLAAAFEAAEASASLVTIGIEPDHPATGYGYIHLGEKVLEKAGQDIFRVRQFKEKPDLETARKYVESGDYYWNAGMFIWSAPTIADALAKHTPKLKEGLDRIWGAWSEGGELADLLAELYPNLEKISIDFAVMEKAENTLTLRARFDWDDVGSWTALERHFPKDDSGNTVSGDAVALDSSGNIVVSGKNHTVALIGVKDLVVARADDATLVCHKSQAQNIKELVRRLGEDERRRRLL